VLSLDFASAETYYLREPADLETPQRIFERQWALLVLERAMQRLESERQMDGKADQFAALRPLLTGGDELGIYRDVGGRLGLSEAAVKMAVHRLRQQFRTALRLEIAQTVAETADIDEEIRELFAVLAGNPV
jgi:RNA polymerase sigma-70 factor (ECF subfamily)